MRSDGPLTVSLSVAATSSPFAAATALPLASTTDGFGFLMAGSLMNVNAVMKMRITAAPIVQPISSFVLPWICAAVRPRRALYLNSEYSSVPSTPAKMNSARTNTITYSVWMLSAFGEPPDSGNSSPAWARGAASRSPAAAAGNASSRRRRMRAPGTGPAVYGRDRRRRAANRRGVSERSPTAEARRALLHEGLDALEEVAGGRELLLDRRLELQLLLHAGELPGVELPLGAGVGAGRPLREPGGELLRGGLERVVGHHPVDETPLMSRGGGHPLAQHGHLRGTCEPDALGDQQRRAAVGHQADVHEGQQEVGRLGGDHEVAGQREAAADARGGAVDGGQHRLGHRADAGDDRVIALAQGAADVRAALGRGVEARLEVGARAERAPVAGDQHGAHVVVDRRLLDRGPQVVRQRPIPGVHGLRTVEAKGGHALMALDLNGHLDVNPLLSGGSRRGMQSARRPRIGICTALERARW